MCGYFAAPCGASDGTGTETDPLIFGRPNGNAPTLVRAETSFRGAPLGAIVWASGSDVATLVGAGLLAEQA